MYNRSAARLQKTAFNLLKRGYSATPEEPASSAARKLAEEALAQKTGAVKGKVTLPKGDKKPTKASGSKDSNMKEIALVGGILTGGALGGLFYYGKISAQYRRIPYS